MTKTITIIGVGALGSHVVQFLRSEDVNLTIIDFDRVERKNTASQFHGAPHIGKAKVNALSQTMNFLYKRPVKTIAHRLTTDNVEQLLGKADLLIDCLDNGASREIVQTYARANEVPTLHGGLAADGSYGRVVWDKDFTIDYEDGEGAATCEDGDFLPFIAITAAYLARAAQSWVRDGRQVGFDITPAGAFRR